MNLSEFMVFMAMRGEEYYLCFFAMIKFGLRGIEIEEFNDRLEQNSGYGFLYRTAKTNEIRGVDFDQLSAQDVIAMNKFIGLPTKLSRNQMRYAYKIFASHAVQKTLKKSINLHSFRHYYAKRLYTETQSVSHVAADMAISNGTAYGYISSNLTSMFT